MALRHFHLFPPTHPTSSLSGNRHQFLSAHQPYKPPCAHAHPGLPFLRDSRNSLHLTSVFLLHGFFARKPSLPSKADKAQLSYFFGTTALCWLGGQYSGNCSPPQKKPFQSFYTYLQRFPKLQCKSAAPVPPKRQQLSCVSLRVQSRRGREESRLTLAVP